MGEAKRRRVLGLPGAGTPEHFVLTGTYLVKHTEPNREQRWILKKLRIKRLLGERKMAAQGVAVSPENDTEEGSGWRWPVIRR